MIPNMWYAVLGSNEVKRGKPVAFKRLNQDLVFWRDGQGKITVMRDLCPHRQARLSQGRIIDDTLQCPFHGFQYDRSGVCQCVPANGRSGPRPKILHPETYPSREEFGFIWVWYGQPRAEYPPLPYFDDLANIPYATCQIHWKVHYTRAIESLLDVSHLPFVHANTIGRGNHTVVNGPYVTFEGEKLRVWIDNQEDHGQTPLKASEMGPSNRPAFLWFNLPNIWQIHFASSARIVQILAPVDEQNTVLYMRSYQDLGGPAFLSRTAAFIGNYFNRAIARQDERVVIAQSPKKSGLEIGQHFIPADRPIILYLQRRQQLIAAAASDGEP